jgi:hypothetical protein
MRAAVSELVESLRSLHVKDKESTDMVLLLARPFFPSLPALCSVSGGIRRMTAPTLQRYHNIISGEDVQPLNQVQTDQAQLLSSLPDF